VTDQALGVSRAEGAATTQQEDRLKQGSFAGTITAPDQVVAGVQVQLGVLDAAKVVHG
jgi:hypothetical protein